MRGPALGGRATRPGNGRPTRPWSRPRAARRAAEAAESPCGASMPRNSSTSATTSRGASTSRSYVSECGWMRCARRAHPIRPPRARSRRQLLLDRAAVVHLADVADVLGPARPPQRLERAHPRDCLAQAILPPDPDQPQARRKAAGVTGRDLTLVLAPVELGAEDSVRASAAVDERARGTRRAIRRPTRPGAWRCGPRGSTRSGCRPARSRQAAGQSRVLPERGVAQISIRALMASSPIGRS